jgi:hypothetical protein
MAEIRQLRGNPRVEVAVMSALGAMAICLREDGQEEAAAKCELDMLSWADAWTAMSDIGRETWWDYFTKLLEDAERLAPGQVYR